MQTCRCTCGRFRKRGHLLIVMVPLKKTRSGLLYRRTERSQWSSLLELRSSLLELRSSLLCPPNLGRKTVINEIKPRRIGTRPCQKSRAGRRASEKTGPEAPKPRKSYFLMFFCPNVGGLKFYRGRNLLSIKEDVKIPPIKKTGLL